MTDQPLPQVDVTTLRRAMEGADRPHLVDVREPGEFAAGHVPGAVNVPMSVFVDRAAEVTELPGDVYLVCRSGNRSGQVQAWLAQQGHRTLNVTGGTMAWQEAGLPLE